ncbi:unnamed protein product, partial [marine sediment metagenome]
GQGGIEHVLLPEQGLVLPGLVILPVTALAAATAGLER